MRTQKQLPGMSRSLKAQQNISILRESIKRSVKLLTVLKIKLNKGGHPIKGTKNVQAFNVIQW
jgi:hypothetical protein